MANAKDMRVAEEQVSADWVNKLIDERLAVLREKLSRAQEPQSKAIFGKTLGTEEKRLIGTRESENGIFFGRIDLDDGSETFYIGRELVEDVRGDAAVVQWQAPMAKAFYEATPAKPMGLGRRSSITMFRTTVRQVSDETMAPGFDVRNSVGQIEPPPGTVTETAAEQPAAAAPSRTSNEQEKPESLHDADLEGQSSSADDEGYVRARDLLLEELERSRDGKMREAIRTLQAEQYELISAAIDRPLVIQGGPGTGKTVVALHRASWVLYQLATEGGLNGADCLVVGPNSRFVEYVSSVIPGLGSSGGSLRQSVLADLGYESVPQSDRARVKATRVETAEASRIKGSSAMVAILENDLWARGEEAPNLSVQVARRITIDLSPAFLLELKAEVYSDGDSYLRSRESFVRRIGEFVYEYVMDEIDSLGEEGDTAEAAATQSRAKVVEAVRTRLLDRVFPRPTPHALVRDLFSRRSALAAASAGLLTRREVDEVHHRDRAYEWTPADIALIDEAASLLGHRVRSYSHIVVDEAQDLSPIEWRMISRRSRNGSLTAVGDIAQGTSVWSPESWDRVLEANNFANASVMQLQLGYRVPGPILGFANRLLRHVGPDLPKPKSLRTGARPKLSVAKADVFGPELLRLIESLPEEGSQAVIGRTELLEMVGPGVGARYPEVELLSPIEAKGLEFDHVVVLDPDGIAAGSESGLQQLYVALTRPTKSLRILAVDEMPSVLA